MSFMALIEKLLCVTPLLHVIMSHDRTDNLIFTMAAEICFIYYHDYGQ